MSRLEALERDESIPELARSKTAAALSVALERLGRLSGDHVRQELTEAELLRHPKFRRAVDKMLETLTPWPAALRALGETLSRMADGRAFVRPANGAPAVPSGDE